MEAIAAASSIAGIVSLAGEALNGIIKLRGFFKDCASASKTIDRFLRDLNSLIGTLEDVKSIVVRLEGAVAFDTKSILSSLQIQLEDCTKDVYIWVAIASEQHPKFAVGSKATFKKFLVAANKESISDIFKEISSHRDNIALKLSIVGRCATFRTLLMKYAYWYTFRSFDVEHAICLQSMNTKLDDVAIAAHTSIKVTTDALRQLEEQLSTGKDDLPGTPSLRSLATSISRIESILSSHVASIQSGHGSARGSSLGSQKPAFSVAGSNGSSCGSRGSRCGSRRVSAIPLSPQMKKAMEELKAKRASEMLELEQGNKSVLTQQMPSPTVQAEARAREAEDRVKSAEKISHPPPNEVLKVSDDCYDFPVGKNVNAYPRIYLQYREQNLNVTDALLGSYRGLLDIAEEDLPEALLEYVDLVQCYRTISIHAKLIESIYDARRGGFITYVTPLQATTAYKEVENQLDKVRNRIGQIRQACWETGYDLEEIDAILGFECVRNFLEPPKARVIDSQIAPEEYQQDLLALRNRLKQLEEHQVWSSKQDRINSWLLQNLIASDGEAELHRSFLPDSDALNEKEWARMVLKFWPVDGAAIKDEKRVESSHGAVRSGRPCHSVRVLLDRLELEDIDCGMSVSAFSDGFGLSRFLELERLGKALHQPVIK